MNYELNGFFVYNGFVIEKKLTKETRYFFDQSLLDNFALHKYRTLWELGFFPKSNAYSPLISFLHTLATTFIDTLTHDPTVSINRKAPLLSSTVSYGLLEALPFAPGMEYVDPSWIEHIWSELSQIFEIDIANSSEDIYDYLRSKNESIRPIGRVYFHLVESPLEEFPFAFLATYSTGTKEKIQHLPLKNALNEYKDQPDKLVTLLSTVSKISEQSALIMELLTNGELFAPLKFDITEAHTFLREIPLYEECGVLCRIPNWWCKTGNARVSIAIGEQSFTHMGLDTLISFTPQLYLGELLLSRSELVELLEQSSGLAMIKGKWVEVDHSKLQAVLAAFDQALITSNISLREALRIKLGLGKKSILQNNDLVTISNGQWLKQFQNTLCTPAQLEDVVLAKSFTGELRSYQQLGLNWLTYMYKLGLGALLADDMGLGKTIQVLALLDHLRLQTSVKTLLVVPASLIGNWQNELQSFSPHIRYHILHGNNKTMDLTNTDLFITTYNMLARLDELQTIHWDILILDEAQAIKNHNTIQSRSAKSLLAKFRIAITGTPIENNLSDLWSIFDFLNKGLLGSATEFTRFVQALRSKPTGYARLRGIIAPFTLRRLKSDKSIIADLPDKIELTAFIELSNKQTALYNMWLDKLSLSLESAEGINRRGLVLSSLTKLKQICNHPDHYLGLDEFKPRLSGKFMRLGELCTSIAAQHEKVLIFTQFREICQPLANYLSELFGHTGLVLHGDTPINKRRELVALFNSEQYIPFMVLSLKVGGVGLNLTAANHVIHFDRWWNPAVENQATDRAFRIGQNKNVLVHKFVTKGTLEEKINLMLERKQHLAGDIITSSGKNWLFELDNQELMDLLRLEG